MTPEIKAVIEEGAKLLSLTHNAKAIDLDKFLLVKKIIQEVIEHPEKYGLVTQDKYDRLYEELKKWT